MLFAAGTINTNDHGALSMPTGSAAGTHVELLAAVIKQQAGRSGAAGLSQ